MFTDNFEPLERIEIDEASLQEGKQYLNAINRGGLIKPSKLVFVTCVHISDLIEFIRRDKNLLSQLYASRNSRSVFMESFIYKLKESEQTRSILRASCAKGHVFKEFIRMITSSIFNMVAKNMVKEINNEIHANRKRTKEKQDKKKR